VNIQSEALTGVGAGGEVKILALFVEHGVGGIAHAIGYPRGFRAGERVQMDGAEIVRQNLRVR
jgi:hypothetical protein